MHHGRPPMQTWRGVPLCEAANTEAEATLTAVDVGEAKSYSPALRMVNQCVRRDRVVVNVSSSQEGSNLTFTGTVRISASKEKE
ncbi:hypothetical protein D1007_40484 [Hordeum vulgare]|nr:hypothetical protein D1007_40484 [Hordeum vulgare]